MNTKAKESTTKEIPLLIRSAQWTVAERTENQISAVCYKSKQDDMIMQLNQKIVQQTQKIEQLNQKIDSQNKLIDQQNRKIDDLNDQLHLQDNLNARLQNNTAKSPSSGSQFAILMADPNSNPNATVFGSKIKRSEISAIYVKNTLEDVPATAWDVSAARDGSVMAWTCTASDIVSRILYLAANGDTYANPDCSYLFANYTKLTAADFSHLKTNLVTNMKYMFYFCGQLQALDVSHWNVSNVNDMWGMFYFCKQLQSLDISHWDVSNVTYMGDMFYFCEQLQTLDVSQWNVSNVTAMVNMFSHCPYINQLEKGALSSWKLNPDVTMENICDGTKFQDNPMDLFNKEIQENTNTKTNVPSILMANPNLSIFTSGTVFGSKVKRHQISAIYTKNTLKNIPATAWDVSADKNESVMAWTEMDSDGKMYILYLAADGYIYANPDCGFLFCDYKNLVDVDFTYLKTDLVTDMHNMFQGCNQLKSLNASHWDVSSVTNMESMFLNCQQLKSLNASHWDVSSITNMRDMFWNCNQLQSLDISNWNISKKANTTNMFYGCKCLNQKNH